MSAPMSVGMIDIATISQMLSEYGLQSEHMSPPSLSPSNEFQYTYLNWYSQNWMTAQHVRLNGHICDSEVELSAFLARNGHRVHLPLFDEGELGMAAISNLSGGLHVLTNSTHIITTEGFYKGLQIEMRAVEVYTVPNLEWPLVKVKHSRNCDLWMAVSNVVFDDTSDADFTLHEFATTVMQAKRKVYDAAQRWAYVEIPEVKTVIYREAQWLNGLEVNGRVLCKVLQVCPFEISKGNVWGMSRPLVASDVITGPPPISFTQDLIVWASYFNERLLSPVINVPTSMWQKA